MLFAIVGLRIFLPKFAICATVFEIFCPAAFEACLEVLFPARVPVKTPERLDSLDAPRIELRLDTLCLELPNLSARSFFTYKNTKN